MSVCVSAGNQAKRSVFDKLSSLDHAADNSRIAVSCGEVRVSYPELLKRAAVLAASMSAAGVKEGQLLAVLVGTSIDFVVAELAASHAGVVFFPIDSGMPAPEVLHSMRLMDPAWLLITADFDQDATEVLKGSEWDPALTEVQVWRSGALLKRSSEVQALPKELQGGGFLRCSSGTTGSAKGVGISQQSAWERAAAAVEGRLVQEDDKVLCLLPLPYHFVVSVLLFLQTGAELVLPEDATLPTLRSTLEGGVTTIYAAPFQLELLSSFQEVEHSLRHVMSTSIRLQRSVAEAFTNRMGVPVVQLLGNIEVGLPFANLTHCSEDPTLLGEPLPAYELQLRNEQGGLVSSGESGELFLQGPGMFDCYVQPYTPRAEVLKDGWFSTGDILRESTPGCFEHCGRTVAALNIAGHKVFAEEIEEVLLGYEGVKEAVIFGEEHKVFGTVLKAQVVLSSPEVTRQELKRYLRDRLSPFKVPTQFVFCESLPKTKTGKVQRVRQQAA